VRGFYPFEQAVLGSLDVANKHFNDALAPAVRIKFCLLYYLDWRIGGCFHTNEISIAQIN